MANPSDSTQLKSAFFHSVNKTMVMDTQASYETVFSSNHVTQTNDILGDSLPYLATELEVDTWILNNPGVIYKYDMSNLTEIPGTNGQSWYINDSGVWQRPIIINTLISDASNTPAFGYIFELYTDSSDRIGEGVGRWWVDPYQGIIHFDKNYTPFDQGYGLPKVKCYAYIGNKLFDILGDIDSRISNLESGLITHTHEEVNGHRITINEGDTPSSINSFDMWVDLSIS